MVNREVFKSCRVNISFLWSCQKLNEKKIIEKKKSKINLLSFIGGKEEGTVPYEGTNDMKLCVEEILIEDGFSTD